jgi:hypothetical protein
VPVIQTYPEDRARGDQELLRLLVDLLREQTAAKYAALRILDASSEGKAEAEPP